MARVQKVLFFTSWYPDDIAPIPGVFIEEQAVALSRHYDLLVFYILPLIKQYLKTGQVWQKDIWMGERLSVRLARRKLLVPQTFERLFYPAYLAAARFWLGRILRDWGRPDIIHAQVTLPAGWAAVKLGKELGIPVVLSEHLGPFSDFLKTSYTRQKVRETLPNASRVVAVSPALVDDIRAFEPRARFEVIGNLVNTRYFAPASSVPEIKPPGREVRLLCVANFLKAKGVNYLIEAVDQLRGKGQFHLNLGGTGPEEAGLNEMVSRLKLERHVSFLGSLSRQDVRKWLHWADVLILPSLGETFGLVLGEAMACGKPVIATRCGGPEFVVTPETGLLVEPASAPALAAAIAEMMRSLNRYDPAVIRAQVVERFGEEAFVDRIRSLYEETAV